MMRKGMWGMVHVLSVYGPQQQYQDPYHGQPYRSPPPPGPEPEKKGPMDIVVYLVGIIIIIFGIAMAYLFHMIFYETLPPEAQTGTNPLSVYLGAFTICLTGILLIMIWPRRNRVIYFFENLMHKLD
jgi:NADH:ubiquinone oxidoreductase subunit 3 (subunit A)